MNKKKELKKEIGLFSLISLGVGSIVGSGIFALPSVMGAVAGPSLILAILFAGIITLFLGIAYAELGAAFPITGGPYALPRLALGDLGGFIMGWGYFVYLFIGTAAIIDIFVVYLGFYIPGLAVGTTLTPIGISIAVIALWIFTWINVIGVKYGAAYSVITTIGRMIPLAIFVLAGLFYFKGGDFIPFMPFGFTGVTLAMTLFFWSFTGFETVVVPSEEVKNPHRTIPLAMILTVLITLVVYLAIAFIFVGMIPWEGLGMTKGAWSGLDRLTSPLSDIAKGHNALWLAVIVTIGAIIATAGSGGIWVLVQGRVPFAMARDKLFWKPLAKVHPKYKTPALSLIFTSILTTIILIAIPSFPSVALIASITAVVPYAAAVLAVPILRKTKPKVKRPFRLPLHFAISLIGFILSSFLIYWASFPWPIVGGILMISGYPIFLLVRRKKIEFMRNIWILVYLLGIMIVSYLGDPAFEYNNFLPFSPIGLLLMPYDLIVLGIFSIFIYFWVYKVNTKKRFIIR